MWNKLLAHLLLMAHLQVGRLVFANRSVGLCYKSIDWFSGSGLLSLNGLKEKKNPGYDFSCKFKPENAVVNLSKIFLLHFMQGVVSKLKNVNIH